MYYIEILKYMTISKKLLKLKEIIKGSKSLALYPLYNDNTVVYKWKVKLKIS